MGMRRTPLAGTSRAKQRLLRQPARSIAQAAAVESALHIPRFCRDHPADAVAMTLYRQPDLVATAPASLRERVVHINDAPFAAITELTARRYGTADTHHLHLLATACQESPYGLVRRYLNSGIEIPEWLDDVVRASTIAILALGDRRDDRKTSA